MAVDDLLGVNDLDHRERSIELVALGRRAAEQEMDLLRLLRGDI